jgi:hypothetical protein
MLLHKEILAEIVTEIGGAANRKQKSGGFFPAAGCGKKNYRTSERADQA